jgi:hypothetical protein
MTDYSEDFDKNTLVSKEMARKICKRSGFTLDEVAAAYAARTGETIYDTYVGTPLWVEERLLLEQLARPAEENRP